MGVDVRWIIVLDSTPKEGEWKILEALERRLPADLSPRLMTSKDKRLRTLVVPSFARWEKVSSSATPSPRHPRISKELDEIQEIIGELPLYYSNDNLDSPGNWLDEEETYTLLDSMPLADGTFSLVAGLLADEMLALSKRN